MILVTGAAGLLGREVLGQLSARGMAVRGLDIRPAPSPPDAPIEHVDLLHAGACRRACRGVQVLIHAAARQHHSDMPRWGRDRFFAANVAMTRNVVEAALSAGVRHIVMISSDMVYGRPPGRPLSERDRPEPIGPYGLSKLQSEQACLETRRRGVVVTVFRPRLMIGPGRLGVLRKLFDRVRTGRAVPIFGPGRHRYQMVSVSDVARACVLAVRQERGGFFNLGSANPPTVGELLEELCRRVGSPSRIVPLPAAAARAALWLLHAVRLSPLAPEQFRIADCDYVLDWARAAETLGWRPLHGDVDMLTAAYESYVAGLSSARAAPPILEASLTPRAAR